MAGGTNGLCARDGREETLAEQVEVMYNRWRVIESGGWVALAIRRWQLE